LISKMRENSAVCSPELSRFLICVFSICLFNLRKISQHE
jgi:hypothetical protein